MSSRADVPKKRRGPAIVPVIAESPTEPHDPPPEAFVELWQLALDRAAAEEIRLKAELAGRALITTARAAGAAVSWSAAAIQSALTTPGIEAAEVASRILDATALAVDSWSAAALDPSVPHWLSTQTQELQEHVRQLEEMTLVDPLTKLFNRRHFDRAIDTEIARARRYKLDLCMIMVDVDFFKRINDTYGHIIGDEVLGHVGEVLVSQARKSDIVVRYGGEEFAVILPETAFEFAGAVAERMRKTLESQPVAFGDGVVISVTASMGCSTLAETDTPRSMMERADAALYRAKQNGRNRVET